MDLKEILGDKYSDGMSFEEIQGAFEGLNLVDPSTLPPMVDKATFDRTSSELAELKKRERARMTEAEQQAANFQEQQERIANLEKENTRMQREHEFLAKGYDSETAAACARHLSEGNYEEFMKVHGSWLEKERAKMQADIKKELLGKVPKINTGVQEEPAEDTAVMFAQGRAKVRADQISQSEKTIQAYLK